jgi:SAM-dependent methyltransferase
MPTPRELVPPQSVLPPYARDKPGDETAQHYLGSGRRFLEAARARGLEPHHRVLDLGCGVGRFAVALAGFLDRRGSYVGVDVNRRSIRICREHIGSKLANFSFIHIGLFNTEYNPRADHRADEFRFPFKRKSFDFVFSNSLFTHLVPDDAEQYLMEIGRVLRPGGRTMNTMFLLNDESLAALDAPDSRQGPTREFGGGIARVKDLENPEAWIAFDERFIRCLHKRGGASGRRAGSVRQVVRPRGDRGGVRREGHRGREQASPLPRKATCSPVPSVDWRTTPGDR